MTPISEIVFQAQVLPVNLTFKTTGYGILDGGWLRATQGCQAAHVSAADAPVDAPDVYQWTYGPGHPYGNGCSVLIGWEGLAGDTSSRGQHSYAELYESGHIRILGANGGTTAEMGGDGFKLFGYWGTGCKNTGNGTELIGWGQKTVSTGQNNVQTSTLRTQFRHQGCVTQANGTVNRNYNQNKFTGAPIQVGKWHQYEAHFVTNTVGQDDGVLRFYVDGVLMMEHTDVRYRNATHPRGFFLRHYNPVFNGNPSGAPTKTENTFLQLSDVYMSVRTQVD